MVISYHIASYHEWFKISFFYLLLTLVVFRSFLTFRFFDASECSKVVSTDEFMSACVESVCRYGEDGGPNSACCAFEALIRECVRQEGKGAGSWRQDDFCRK